MRLAHSLATVAAVSPDQFRNRSIHDVVSKLDLALPGISLTVAPSSVAQARARLGSEPMEWLFTICAEHRAHASARSHGWRGLALYGVDGTTLRVPDSTDNARYFGYSHSVRGESAYPMVRGVGLMALRSHLLAAVAFGPYAAGEISYATNLWSSLPREPALARAPAARTPRRARRARGLARSSQAGPEPARALGRASGHLPAEGLPPADPAHFADRSGRVPADEIAMLYHERWELELGYDEIKTELLDREEAIRSRTPTGVQQELWGIFLAYNLVRLEMERVASDAGVEPTRISFVAALRLICDEWLWCALASPGAIPKHLRNLRASLETLILPPRRPERRFPRAVKIEMSNYARKRRKGSK